MESIRLLILKIMDESVKENPSWMTVRSYCSESLRLLNALKKRKKNGK